MACSRTRASAWTWNWPCASTWPTATLTLSDAENARPDLYRTRANVPLTGDAQDVTTTPGACSSKGEHWACGSGKISKEAPTRRAPGTVNVSRKSFTTCSRARRVDSSSKYMDLVARSGNPCDVCASTCGARKGTHHKGAPQRSNGDGPDLGHQVALLPGLVPRAAFSAHARVAQSPRVSHFVRNEAHCHGHGIIGALPSPDRGGRVRVHVVLVEALAKNRAPLWVELRDAPRPVARDAGVSAHWPGAREAYEQSPLRNRTEPRSPPPFMKK
jgi:hypothetical protein